MVEKDLGSDELSDIIVKPEVYVTTSPRFEYDDDVKLTTIHQLGGIAKQAFEHSMQEADIVQSLQEDPNVKKFVIITDPLVTVSARIVQQKGFFRRGSYSLEMGTTVKPKRDIQVEKF